MHWADNTEPNYTVISSAFITPCSGIQIPGIAAVFPSEVWRGILAEIKIGAFSH